MKKSILIALMIGVVSGCYYHNEEELYGETVIPCDTAGATYTNAMLPVLQNSCFACHNSSENATAGGSLNFEDFSLLQALATGGNLLGALNHDQGFTPMPKGQAKLDSCSIAKIKAWIDSGAPNN